MLARLFKLLKNTNSTPPQSSKESTTLSLEIEQIGIWPIKTHVVRIEPGIIPAEASAALDKIMNLSQEDSRRAYGNYSFFANLNNFLGSNNQNAIEIRKNRIVPYLVPLHYYESVQQSMKDLLQKFSSAEEVIEDYGSHQIISDPNSSIITHHCMDIFLRVFLNAEMDNATKELIQEIESEIPNPYLLLAPNVLQGAIRYIPNIANKIAKFDAAITKFVHAQLIKVKNENFNTSSKRNWWRDAIELKFPGKEISKLTKEDISILTKDPDVRLSIQIILGVSNLTDVLNALIRSLFQPEYESGHRFLNEIKDEIERVGPITQNMLTNKDLMPHLHAAYLEALRLKSTFIVRYTSQELQLNEKLTIPANSYITFYLDIGRKLFNSKYPPYEYSPYRFIDPATKKLNDDAIHALKMFHPFGLGPRQCAGQHVAEVFCKSLLVSLVQNVLVWKERRVIVNQKVILHPKFGI